MRGVLLNHLLYVRMYVCTPPFRPSACLLVGLQEQVSVLLRKEEVVYLLALITASPPRFFPPQRAPAYPMMGTRTS